MGHTISVVAGLVPATHIFSIGIKSWMAGLRRP